MNTMNNRPMHAAPPYSVRPNSRHNGDTHSHPVLNQDAHVTLSSPHIYQYSTDNVGNGKKSIPVNKSTNNAYCCDKDSSCEDNDRKAFDDVNNGNSGSQGSSMGLNSAYLAEIGLHVNHLNQKNQQSLGKQAQGDQSKPRDLRPMRPTQQSTHRIHTLHHRGISPL